MTLFTKDRLEYYDRLIDAIKPALTPEQKRQVKDLMIYAVRKQEAKRVLREYVLHLN